jgi:hypothetical protein
MERQLALRRFRTFDEMKAESYRYWRQQPDHVRLAAVTELNAEIFALKGIPGDASRLQRVVQLLKR